MSRLVVGVGASAGGLEAIQAFVRELPADVPLAVIVVQHTDPSGEGLLAKLLARESALPVSELREGMTVETGRVYVAPPRTLVSLEDDVLRTRPTDDGRGPTPVDALFASLSHARGEGAVGVVLSGTGADGTLGLEAIAERGGLTMAQDRPTARFPAMPENAASSGVTDHVRPPVELARELLIYANHFGSEAFERTREQRRADVRRAIPEITEVLRDATDRDFRHYRRTTLERRILRRIQVLHLDAVDDYVARLKGDRDEADALLRELLIGVTCFFRDPEAFDRLAEVMVPALAEEHDPDSPVRIWVPGCSTGEEAYSLAMLFFEHADAEGTAPSFQIFATDIDERALRIARRGAYPMGIREDVSEERLRRFFVQRGHRYHVIPELRERVVFSDHDLIAHPPFSRQDLISCRNLLIYLGSALQKKLVSVFHYALNPGGYLFLGPAETITSHRELFRPVDAKHRIAQRRPTPGRTGLSRLVRESRSQPPRAGLPDAEGSPDLLQIMQRIVLDEFAPRALVVNGDGQILSVSGNMERFLRVDRGDFRNDVIQLVRADLRVGLRSALHEAHTSASRVVRDDLSVRTDTGLQPVRITVQPMPGLGEQDDLFLVVFDEPTLPIAVDGDATQAQRDEATALIDQLERELDATRDELERSVQELEATNEELKSSNEELLSMNEELQSANEELETSKEEVQSANDALARAHDDLENLLRSTEIATLFLDGELRVRSFTPAIGAIYHLLESDIGRPIWHITHRAVEMPELPAAADLQGRAEPIDDRVETEDGRRFLRRVLPYRTREGDADGIVVTFVDVTDLTAAQDALRESEARYRQAVEAADVGTWRVDFTSEVATRDASLSRLLGQPAGERTVPLEDYLSRLHEDDRQRCERALKDAVERGAIYDLENRVVRDDGQVRWLRDRGRALRDEQGRVVALVGAAVDVTERRRAEEELRASLAELESLYAAIPVGVGALDRELRYLRVNDRLARVNGASPQAHVGRRVGEILDGEMARFTEEAAKRVFGGESIHDLELHAQPPGSDEPRWWRVSYSPIEGAEGGIDAMSVVVHDVTEQRRAERERGRLGALVESSADFVGVTELDGRLLYLNPAGRDLTDLDGSPDPETVEALVYEDDAAAFREALATARDERRWRGDLRLRCTSTGAPIEASVDLFSIDDPTTGRPANLGVVARDLREVRRIEAELMESRNRLMAMAHGLPNVIWRTDPDGNLTWVSRRWEEITGLDPEETVREGATEAFHPDDLPTVEAIWRRHLDRRTELQGEVRLRNPDGDYRWFLVRGTPVLDADGAVAEWVGSFTDVHALKELQAELVESDARKNEFLAMLGHELRNPLAPILSAADLLARDDAIEHPRELRNAAAAIERQAWHLARMVDDLLDVARLSRGRVTLRRRTGDLREQVRAGVEANVGLIESRGHRLEVRMPDAPVTCRVDPTRTTQIVSNLVNNAAKYAGKNRSIEVSLETEDGWARVRVSDDGPGVDPAVRPYLFEPFTQDVRTLDRAEGGLGLGLSLSRGLADLHGGTLELEDAGDAGTCFVLGLPTADPRTATRSTSPGIVPPQRILVVDDNEDAAAMLAIRLQRDGHDVEVAGDAEEALAAAEGTEFDAMFLDIGLPGMDGHELARELRAREAKVGRPRLVALTGYGAPGDRRRSREAGFEAHLLKPVDMDALREALLGRASLEDDRPEAE